MTKVSVILPDDLHKRLKFKALEQGTDLQKIFLKQAILLDKYDLKVFNQDEKPSNFPERELWHTVLDQVLNGIQHQARADALDAEDNRAIAIKTDLGDAERSALLPEGTSPAKTGNDKQSPGRRTG